MEKSRALKIILTVFKNTKMALIGMMGLLLSACAEKPMFITPEQCAEYRAAEEQRVKEMLSETSPRNQNNLPKAVPEFKARVPGIRVGD